MGAIAWRAALPRTVFRWPGRAETAPMRGARCRSEPPWPVPRPRRTALRAGRSPGSHLSPSRRRTCCVLPLVALVAPTCPRCGPVHPHRRGISPFRTPNRHERTLPHGDLAQSLASDKTRLQVRPLVAGAGKPNRSEQTLPVQLAFRNLTPTSSSNSEIRGPRLPGQQLHGIMEQHNAFNLTRNAAFLTRPMRSPHPRAPATAPQGQPDPRRTSAKTATRSTRAKHTMAPHDTHTAQAADPLQQLARAVCCSYKRAAFIASSTSSRLIQSFAKAHKVSEMSSAHPPPPRSTPKSRLPADQATESGATLALWLKRCILCAHGPDPNQ